MRALTNDGEAGFSVLEAVVALAIIALTLSAFYTGLRVSVTTIQTARDAAAVDSSARSLFAELGVAYPLTEGTRTVRLAGTETVDLEIRRLAAIGSTQLKSGFSLYEIEATFFIPTRTSPPVHFHSLRITEERLAR